MHLGLPHLGLNSGGNVFGPASLFASGAQGAWYDPSDFSSMFQDSAGTTPVTATTQPVGKILDKSGKGNHATQATATSRPTLQQDASGYYYLSFDGVDDSLATGSIDFTSTAQLTAFAGVRKLSDASVGIVAGISANTNLNNGAFELRAPGANTTANFSALARGSAGVAQGQSSANSWAAPSSVVLTLPVDFSAPSLGLRVSGADQGSNPAALGGTVGNYPLYVGSRGGTGVYFNGRLYGLIVRGAASTATEIALAERWVGQRMGISL